VMRYDQFRVSDRSRIWARALRNRRTHRLCAPGFRRVGSYRGVGLR
jgi:hypothetical protein